MLYFSRRKIILKYIESPKVQNLAAGGRKAWKRREPFANIGTMGTEPRYG